jgi:hypothetical protein
MQHSAESFASGCGGSARLAMLGRAPLISEIEDAAQTVATELPDAFHIGLLALMFTEAVAEVM